MQWKKTERCNRSVEFSPFSQWGVQQSIHKKRSPRFLGLSAKIQYAKMLYRVPSYWAGFILSGPTNKSFTIPTNKSITILGNKSGYRNRMKNFTSRLSMMSLQNHIASQCKQIRSKSFAHQKYISSHPDQKELCLPKQIQTAYCHLASSIWHLCSH